MSHFLPLHQLQLPISQNWPMRLVPCFCWSALQNMFSINIVFDWLTIPSCFFFKNLHMLSNNNGRIIYDICMSYCFHNFSRFSFTSMLQNYNTFIQIPHESHIWSISFIIYKIKPHNHMRPVLTKWAIN